MKKLFLFVLFCIFSVVLVSCSVPYEFSKDMSDLDQIQIEIVNLESEMGYHAGSSYNEENISVIKIIENEKKEDFLLDFKKIKSYQPNIGSRIDSITGKAIRITYPNGDIELITQYGTATVKMERFIPKQPPLIPMISPSCLINIHKIVRHLLRSEHT